VGEHRRDELVLADRLAERRTRLRVVARIVRRALGEAETLCPDPRARSVEHAHREREALPLVAQPVRGRDAAVLEEELTRRRALDPELRLDPPDLEAGGVRLDHERADAAVTRALVGLR